MTSDPAKPKNYEIATVRCDRCERVCRWKIKKGDDKPKRCGECLDMMAIPVTLKPMS